jgi:ABC-type antimicrobial peptide transport system permease subunit
VFGYVAAICVLTAILFGLAPALHVSKTNNNDVLKEGGRGSVGNRRVRRLSGSIVVAELALSLVLLAGAGLMVRSFLKLYTLDIGFRTDRLITMRMQLPESKYASVESARTIVGVVGDIKHGGLNAVEGPVVYVPFAQTSFAFVNWMGIVVRGPAVTTAVAAVKAAVGRVDPNQPVTAVQSMEEYVARETAPFRFSSLIVGSLACAAYVLAATGIYGLTAFIVGRRSREVGVRLALGATRGSIVRLVFTQIAATLAAGLLVGTVGGLATSGMLKVALAESADGRGDALAVIAGAVLIAVTAVVAGLGPALRAAHMNPKAALQAE